jgi:transcription initiation factor TFIIF subunit beta
MDGIDDEKKPFDAEHPEEEDSQPDPDEHLMLDQGNGRVWLVKVYHLNSQLCYFVTCYIA